MGGIIVRAVLANETTPVQQVGAIEGTLGPKTRQAVKAIQVKDGLPADCYATAELLARMRAGRQGNNCGGFGTTADMLT